MTIGEFKLRFLSVRKCAACNKILDYERANEALCEQCEQRMNRVMLNECGRCIQSVRECSCMPRALSQIGVLCHRKLFFYTAENVHTVGNRLLYKLKHVKHARLSRYFAQMLAVAAREELEVLGNPDAILTFVPRGRRTYNAYGFDQSEELVRHMSKDLNIPYARIFNTRVRAKTQKKLDADERFKNVEENIYVVKGADVTDKYVLLVDDMVTTGASMGVCTELSLLLGAKGVLCFSVASKNKM